MNLEGIPCSFRHDTSCCFDPNLCWIGRRIGLEFSAKYLKLSSVSRPPADYIVDSHTLYIRHKLQVSLFVSTIRELLYPIISLIYYYYLCSLCFAQESARYCLDFVYYSLLWWSMRLMLLLLARVWLITFSVYWCLQIMLQHYMNVKLDQIQLKVTVLRLNKPTDWGRTYSCSYDLKISFEYTEKLLRLYRNVE